MNYAAESVEVGEAIGCHSHRKTFGYHAYKLGTDIVLLQQIFNHSSPSVTLRYIGILQCDIDRVLIIYRSRLIRVGGGFNFLE
ncbi:integrase [Paenibacillus alkaliterrae]|uniref:integrase n=1 Tax=Paenibacillus alkaliterrae TaxID=320909 RepID=UPI002285A19D|nr:integrase [Paenibacillus alkaliterrae]